MNHNRLLKLAAALSLLVMVVFSGCKPDDDDGPGSEPPIDQDPQVTLVSHPNGYVLSEVGDIIDIEFELHDNERLVSYRLTEKQTSVSGVVVVQERNILSPNPTEALSSTFENRGKSYLVPAVPVYTKIEITAYATDNKGKVATATLNINVIPTAGSGPAYDIQEYLDGDTIWFNASPAPNNGFNFDLINRQNGPDAAIPMLQRDLRDASIGSFQATFISPNNGAADSVLVHTNLNSFNFDQMDYQTTYQAFVTSNQIGNKVGPVAVGDVILLKMANSPHFAAIRVDEINATNMVFSYKYSYN